MSDTKKLQDDMKEFAQGLAQDAFNKGYLQAIADVKTGLEAQLKAVQKVLGEE